MDAINLQLSAALFSNCWYQVTVYSVHCLSKWALPIHRHLQQRLITWLLPICYLRQRISKWVLPIYHVAVAATLLCRSCYQFAARFSNVLANGCNHSSICSPPVLTKRCYQFAVVQVTYLQMGDISLQIVRYYVVACGNTYVPSVGKRWLSLCNLFACWS